MISLVHARRVTYFNFKNDQVRNTKERKIKNGSVDQISFYTRETTLAFLVNFVSHFPKVRNGGVRPFKDTIHGPEIYEGRGKL